MPASSFPPSATPSRSSNPRSLAKNPVMFVVAVVSALTTVLFLRDLVTGGANLGFSFQIILWLWFTVLFANFAEAVAEGRGKAQAESLRQLAHRDAGQAAHRRRPTARLSRSVPGTSLQGRRRGPRRGRRHHSVRRRSHRGRRLGQRSGRSPASPRRSSANPAATARPSPAARRCCPTGSACASRRRPARPSSTA